MTWLVTIAPMVILDLIYVTNVGQVVHRTPDPNWFERIGRRR